MATTPMHRDDKRGQAEARAEPEEPVTPPAEDLPANRFSNARVNAAGAVFTATTLVALGLLAVRVGQEPAAQSAWRSAAADCSRAVDSTSSAVKDVATAFKSAAAASHKTASIWRQHRAAALAVADS